MVGKEGNLRRCKSLSLSLSVEVITKLIKVSKYQYFWRLYKLNSYHFPNTRSSFISIRNEDLPFYLSFPWTLGILMWSGTFYQCYHANYLQQSDLLNFKLHPLHCCFPISLKCFPSSSYPISFWKFLLLHQSFRHCIPDQNSSLRNEMFLRVSCLLWSCSLRF